MILISIYHLLFRVDCDALILGRRRKPRKLLAIPLQGLLQPHDMLVIAMEGEAREMVPHGDRVNVDDVPAFVSLIGIQIYRQRLNFRLRL